MPTTTSNPIEHLISRVNLGEPSTAHGLRVFPLFPLDPDPVRLLLLADAIAGERAVVREAETTQGPWYRELLIETHAELPVLLREADLLGGGKQDRVADRTCLLPAHSSTTVPVSCVQAGRSHYEGAKAFRSYRTSADLMVRSARLRGQAESPGAADQSRTWQMIADRRRSAGDDDEAGSLGEYQERQNPKVDATVEALPPLLGACGLVLACTTSSGPRVVAMEVFGDRDACHSAWPGLVRSAAQGVNDPQSVPRITRTEVRKLLMALAKVELRPQAPIGLGDLALFVHQKLTGSVLQVDGVVAHLALLRG